MDCREKGAEPRKSCNKMRASHFGISFICLPYIMAEKSLDYNCFFTAAPSARADLVYMTIRRVPAPMHIQPNRDFIVNSSCRKTKAKIRVSTTLNLSMGTTLEASPICRAL